MVTGRAARQVLLVVETFELSDIHPPKKASQMQASE